MLEQPVRVLQDGTIDDRYEFDTYDTMMYEADKVLLSPVEAGEKLLEARGKDICTWKIGRKELQDLIMQGLVCMDAKLTVRDVLSGMRLQISRRRGEVTGGRTEI